MKNIVEKFLNWLHNKISKKPDSFEEEVPFSSSAQKSKYPQQISDGLAKHGLSFGDYFVKDGDIYMIDRCINIDDTIQCLTSESIVYIGGATTVTVNARNFTVQEIKEALESEESKKLVSRDPPFGVNVSFSRYSLDDHTNKNQ